MKKEGWHEVASEDEKSYTTTEGKTIPKYTPTSSSSSGSKSSSSSSKSSSYSAPSSKPSSKGGMDTVIDLRNAPYGEERSPISWEEYNQRTATLPEPKPNYFSLKEYRQRNTIGGKIAKVMTSPMTTAGLGLTLAGLLATPAGTAAASSLIGGGIESTGLRGLFARQVALNTARKEFATAGGKVGLANIQNIFKLTNRQTAGLARELGRQRIAGVAGAITGRFGTNPKTIGLTSNLLSKFTGNAALVLSAIGSYPFAGFIKEEALQTLSMGFQTASENNDIEGMAVALEEQRELLKARGIVDFIPYANVVKELNSFFNAAVKKNKIDEKIFEKKLTSISKGGTGNQYADFRNEGERIKKADSAFFAVLDARKKGTNISEELVELAKDSSYYVGQF